ncbi:putative universal stress protein family [Planoprotostelium fungivorum]|uniref:Putative universal stress protein family n=1 Tax=Planoprotostelium fungivorum TaxID=1890364 RepID=A0A2P6NZY0_9EUKA|nr:putative universal stress protein family [Planoprotostelium fungivorum]
MIYALALDFSKSSDKIIKYFLKMANREEDRAVIISVLEQYDHSLVNAIRVDFDFQILDGANKELAKANNEMLKEFQEKLDRAQIQYEVVVTVGKPSEEICKHAKSKGADVLMVGSHGGKNVKKLILGTTSDYCLNNAQVSDVIVIH